MKNFNNITVENQVVANNFYNTLNNLEKVVFDFVIESSEDNPFNHFIQGSIKDNMVDFQIYLNDEQMWYNQSLSCKKSEGKRKGAKTDKLFNSILNGEQTLSYNEIINECRNITNKDGMIGYGECYIDLYLKIKVINDLKKFIIGYKSSK